MLFDFALHEVGTIRTLLHEALRPSRVVAFKRNYTSGSARLRFWQFCLHWQAFCLVLMAAVPPKCWSVSNTDCAEPSSSPTCGALAWVYSKRACPAAAAQQNRVFSLFCLFQKLGQPPAGASVNAQRVHCRPVVYHPRASAAQRWEEKRWFSG